MRCRFLRAMVCAAVAVFCSLFSDSLQAAKGPQPTICTRTCWTARDSSCSGTMTTLNRAIIHHTAGSEYASSGLESSKSYMRSVQNYHMNTRGWCDIGYHFLVDKYGNIFEGRKNSMTGQPVGAHDGANTSSFGFTALGWYHPDKPGGADQPTTALMNSLYDLIAWRMPSTWSPYGSGSYNGKTVGVLDGHRNVKATACPGDLIYGPYIGSNYNGGAARNGIFERKNPPIAPTALTATAVSTSQINLSWTDNSSVETMFKIERGTSSVGPWTQIGTVNANVKTYSSTGLSINTTYYYRVRANGPLGDSAYSNVANATTQGPGPKITTQPQTQTKDPGQNVTFQVVATGTGTLSYQWRKNGSNLTSGGRISGANTATLIITAVEASDVGAYTVRITDTEGTTTSAEAQLFLNAIVIFQDTFESGNLNNWTTLPSPSTALSISSTNHTSGGSKSAQVNSSLDKMHRSFSPEIEGRARATFWMYDNMGGQTRWFTEVRSYSGSSYGSGSLDQLIAIGRYSINFPAGTGVLVDEKVDTTKYQGRVVYGANAGWFNLSATRTAGWHKFEIERESNGTTYKFYVDGVLARTITGATYATWDTVTIGSLGSGTEVVADAWIDDIKLEYFDAPTILTQPQSITRNAGAGATFSVLATNNVEGYQWRFEGVDISGATTSSYTRSNLTEEDAGAYSVVVRNRAGTVTSANANLTVNLPPTIVDHPEDASAVEGGMAEFTVTATGSGTLSYQWIFEGGDISGATQTKLSLSNISTNQAGTYTVRVTNGSGSATSNPAELSILPPQPSNFADVNASGESLLFTFVGEPGLQYIIESSTNLSNWEFFTNVVLSESSVNVTEFTTNHPTRFFRAYQVE